MSNKGAKLEKENYVIEIKYSEEAIQKRLIKFVPKDGGDIVISADELASILINHVNTETLSATFVEADKINVVEVGRQIRCVLDKDYQKGQEININYSHPYPIEFALIEESMKIAKINQDVPVFTLTAEYIEEVKKKITPKMEDYLSKFYASFRNIKKPTE